MKICSDKWRIFPKNDFFYFKKKSAANWKAVCIGLNVNYDYCFVYSVKSHNLRFFFLFSIHSLSHLDFVLNFTTQDFPPLIPLVLSTVLSHSISKKYFHSFSLDISHTMWLMVLFLYNKYFLSVFSTNKIKFTSRNDQYTFWYFSTFRRHFSVLLILRRFNANFLSVLLA